MRWPFINLEKLFNPCPSVALLIALAGMIAWNENTGVVKAQEQEKRPEAEILTSGENSLLRKAVYLDGIGTSIEIAGPWASKSVVVVPKRVVELHRKKRVATLKLLLEIVRGGRPEDSLAATAFAVTLEINPVAAVPLVYYPAELLDELVRETKGTGRDRLIDSVQELLAKAEIKK